MSNYIEYGKTLVPGEVAEDGDWLTWRLPAATAKENWSRLTDKALISFTRLTTNSEIVEFAKRHGVFGAKELLTTAPKLPNEISVQKDRGRWAVGLPSASREDREPLWIWHLLVNQAKAILSISAGLKGCAGSASRVGLPPQIGSDSDWVAVVGHGKPFEDVLDAQFFLMLRVNDWLSAGGVGLRLSLVELSRKKTQWKVEVSCGDAGYNLFGQLAYQMFLCIANDGQHQLYLCTACQHPYIRTAKAPRAGQDNYCPDCEDVARLQASRRWKERAKAKNKAQQAQGKMKAK